MSFLPVDAKAAQAFQLHQLPPDIQSLFLVPKASSSSSSSSSDDDDDNADNADDDSSSPPSSADRDGEDDGDGLGDFISLGWVDDPTQQLPPFAPGTQNPPSTTHPTPGPGTSPQPSTLNPLNPKPSTHTHTHTLIR